MKQTVESPWSVGDIGWAVLSRSMQKHFTCDSCGKRSDDSFYEQEVRECQIDSIEIRLNREGITYWYRAGFNVGDTYKGSRFTYGAHVKEVFASKEEAEAALAKEQE